MICDTLKLIRLLRWDPLYSWFIMLCTSSQCATGGRDCRTDKTPHCANADKNTALDLAFLCKRPLQTLQQRNVEVASEVLAIQTTQCIYVNNIYLCAYIPPHYCSLATCSTHLLYINYTEPVNWDSNEAKIMCEMSGNVNNVPCQHL